MSTALAIRPEAAAVAATIDDISAGGMDLLRQSGFHAELTLAKAIGEMRVALTAEVMRPVMELMNTSLGFRCDKTYSLEVVRDVLIEAKLRGFRAVGNEFNIIGGRFYAAQNGLRRKVIEWPGLSYFREMLGVPKASGGGGALVAVKATWVLRGTQHLLDDEIPIRVNDGAGADNILGKARRKLYARVLDRLTGIGTPEGDADDVGDQVVEQRVTAPPIPPPPAPKPPGPGPAVTAAAQRAAAPTQPLRAAAQGPAADAGPDPRPKQDLRPAADADNSRAVVPTSAAGAPSQPAAARADHPVPGTSGGDPSTPPPAPYTGPGADVFGQGDASQYSTPLHAPEDTGVNPGPAPQRPVERRGKVDGVSQDGAVAGEINRPDPAEQVPPDPVDPTQDANGVVIVDQIVANLSVAASIADYREQVKAAMVLRRADEKQWLAPAMVTTLMRLLANGPEDELDAVVAALGKFRQGDWISRARLAKAEEIYLARKAAP